MNVHTRPSGSLPYEPISELRFFSAIWNDRKQQPWWFRGVDRASPHLDVQGVDAIAYVLYDGSNRHHRIPLQLKSRNIDGCFFLLDREEKNQPFIPVTIASRNMQDETICTKFFGVLRKVREHGLDFEKTLRALERRRLSWGERKILQDIVESRSLFRIIRPGQEIRATKRYRDLASQTYLSRILPKLRAEERMAVSAASV